MSTARQEAGYDAWALLYREWWAPVIAPSAVALLDRLDGLLPADRPADIVDIGAGTGTLGLAALERWPRARLVATDPSARMLELAAEAARERGLAGRLETRVGTAAELPVRDATMDAAISSFAIQLTPSRSAAVRDAHRVLRPGGVYACVTWQLDDGEPFAPEDAFDDALDALDLDLPAPGGAEPRPYPSPAAAAAELRGAGFHDVDAREAWLEHRFTPQSFLDVAEHWTEEDAFATLEEPMRRRLRAELLTRLERLSPDDLVWRRPLVSVVGRRP